MSVNLVVCVHVCICMRVRLSVRPSVSLSLSVCVFGSVTLALNPTIIYPLTLTTTTAFQPQSKVELQDAVQTCDGAKKLKLN